MSEGVRLSSHPTMLRLNCMPRLSVTQSRLTVRHAHMDGLHGVGANGMDTAGANGAGVNMDGARGVGMRGANMD